MIKYPDVIMFRDTHAFFKFEKESDYSKTFFGCIEADMCRKHFGDNDPTEALPKRKWFTGPGGVYIRHDCLDNELVTWFALKSAVQS